MSKTFSAYAAAQQLDSSERVAVLESGGLCVSAEVSHLIPLDMHLNNHETVFSVFESLYLSFCINVSATWPGHLGK